MSSIFRQNYKLGAICWI